MADLQDDLAPQDGETLGVFVYDDARWLWVYPAGYSDAMLCKRRADSLNKSLCVLYFYVRDLREDGEYYAVANAYPETTAALHAALTKEQSNG